MKAPLATRFAGRLQPSRNGRIGQNRLGRSLDFAARPVWRHPWFTTAEWMPKSGRWVARVKPGFVNGRAPMVATTAAEMREAQGSFFGQLVDARSGAAEIAQLAALSTMVWEDEGWADNTRLDAPLYANPPIRLYDWRRLGWDGSAPPLFLQQRGVGMPAKSVSAQLQAGGKIKADTLTPPQGNRLAVATDIFIQQPRAALTSQIEVSPSGMVTGMSNVRQTLGVRAAYAGEPLRIMAGTYEPLAQERMRFQGAGTLVADYEEQTWDQLPISTVYLASPPDAPLGAAPDATWQPYVAHATFWNLSWAQPRAERAFSDDIFRSLLATVSVLGGGAGLGMANYLAASINDATQSAFNVLQATSLEGSFWTATGTGTAGRSAEKSGPPKKSPQTLDKAVNERARAAEKFQAFLTSMDPAFPYEARAFHRQLLQK